MLVAIPNVNYSFDAWNGDVHSLINPLSVVITSNVNVTASFLSDPVTDGFESGTLSHLSWTSAGDAPWLVQSNVVAVGQYSAKSGVIGDSQSSSLVLTTNFDAGIGSFDYKVSSELNWDYLNFYVDGVLYKKWSGAVDWANYAFSVSAGVHTLKWTYIKDPSNISGLDAAFIDDVNLPVSFVPPPQLQLQRQPGGSLVMTITGQAGSQYVTQVSTNLLTWQNFSTNTAIGGVIQITIPVSTTNQAQFYRSFAP